MSESHASGDGEHETLEDRLTALEQQLDTIQRDVAAATNRDIPLLKGTVRALLHGEVETIDELPAAGRAFGRAVVARGERLSQLEAQVDVIQQSTDPSTKAEKVATVLAFAANKAAADGKVAVTPAEIRGCTGVSRRYAYDLVETIAADAPRCVHRHSTASTTASGLASKRPTGCLSHPSFRRQQLIRRGGCYSW